LFQTALDFSRLRGDLVAKDDLNGRPPQRLRKTSSVEESFDFRANAPEIPKFSSAEVLRRHSLDHMIVLGEAHPRRILDA
jgi:hypothetical protein